MLSGILRNLHSKRHGRIFLKYISSQYRSFALRCRILKERNYLPAFVIGGNDVYTSSSGRGNQYFGQLYAVATKGI